MSLPSWRTRMQASKRPPATKFDTTSRGLKRNGPVQADAGNQVRRLAEPRRCRPDTGFKPRASGCIDKFSPHG